MADINLNNKSDSIQQSIKNSMIKSKSNSLKLLEIPSKIKVAPESQLVNMRSIASNKEELGANNVSLLNDSNLEKKNLLESGIQEKSKNIIILESKINDEKLILNENPKGNNQENNHNYNNFPNTSNYLESNSNNMLELSINKTDNNLLSENNKKPPQYTRSFAKKSFKDERDEDDIPRKELSDLKSQSLREDKYDKDDEEEYGEFGTEAKRKLEKRDKICDSDTEDEGSDNEKDHSWIILPENDLKKLWDVIIALILIYSAVVLPYRIAFIDIDSATMIVFDYIFDTIFFIDIILSFFAAYVDNEDIVVKNRKKIVINYLKTWFIIDLVSVLPVSYLMPANNPSQNINQLSRIARIPKIYRLVKLTKIFRMVKIIKKGNVNRITKYFLEKLKVNANIERLIYFILAFLLLNHLAACVWYFVAKMEDLNPDSWVMKLGYIDSSMIEIYIISFYWTLTTVTTVGYGDIHAGTTAERGYNLVIMSFGVLMYSFAIGSLSSIVSTLDAKTAEMNQKLQILASIKNEFKLDNDIYDKVRKVIKYDLSRNQKDKMNFLQELPNKLRIELSKIMHDKIIKQLYFFRDQPADFIAYVAPLLKPIKFSQNDFLYKIGDMIDEMYFVAKGTISFCLSKDYDEKEIKEIKKNNNFGEIEMCLNEKLSFNIKVKSRNCELFVLKKNDFLRLSVNFKEFIEKFLQKSLMIYLKFNEEKKKAIKLIEDQKGIVPGLLNGVNDPNDDKGNKFNELDKIDEEDEENQDSEEFDIFDDDASSKVSQNTDDSNEDESDEGAKDGNLNKNNYNNDLNSLNLNNRGNNNQNNILTNQNNNKINNLLNINNNNYEFGASDGKRSSYLNSKILENNLINTNNNLNNNVLANLKDDSVPKNKNENRGVLDEISRTNFNDRPEDKGAKNNVEINDQVEKIKNQMNKKFLKKVDKIIEFLDNNSTQFVNHQNNPLELLRSLRATSDIYERNDIIDKIEGVITELFNNQNKQ